MGTLISPCLPSSVSAVLGQGLFGSMFPSRWDSRSYRARMSGGSFGPHGRGEHLEIYLNPAICIVAGKFPVMPHILPFELAEYDEHRFYPFVRRDSGRGVRTPQ